MPTKKKTARSTKSRGKKTVFNTTDVIYVSEDPNNPGTLKYEDGAGKPAKIAFVLRNHQLEFASRVGALTICFNKLTGLPDPAKMGGYADVNKPIRFQIRPNNDGLLFDYSVCLFLDNRAPIPDDPTIIITGSAR